MLWHLIPVSTQLCQSEAAKNLHYVFLSKHSQISISTWVDMLILKFISSISYAREQYCDMLNAICLPTVKKAITEPYTIAYSFCKLRLQHVVNGNAAYTGHRWEGIFTSGWWRGQTVHSTQESQLYTLIWWKANSWMSMLRNTTLLLTTHWNLCPDVGILREEEDSFFLNQYSVWPIHSNMLCFSMRKC